MRSILFVAASLSGIAASTLGSGAADAHPHAGAGEMPPFEREFRVLFDRFGRGGRLGVQVQSMSPELRDYFGAPNDAGVLVSSVVAGSPAEKAGFKAGDVILDVDGEKVAAAADLPRERGGPEGGAEVMLTVLRDRKKNSLTAKIEERGEVPYLPGTWGGDRKRIEGLEERIRTLERRLDRLDKKR